MRDDEYVELRAPNATKGPRYDRAAPGPSALATQFDDLASLPPGWFEPGTPILDHKGLSRVRDFLETVLTRGAPVPHMYPTPEGEAQAEWSFPNWEVSAVFDLKALSARLHATGLESDTSEEAELKIGDSHAVETFARFIEQFTPKSQGA